MYAIRKLPDAKKTVFINFPPTAMAQPLPEHIQWLVDHKINFGFMFGKPVGVYLSREDATAFKLKYGS